MKHRCASRPRLLLSVLALGLLLGSAAPVGAGDEPTPPALGLLGDVRLAAHPVGQPRKTPTDEVAGLLRGALAESNKFVLNTWWDRYMTGVDPYLSAGERAQANQTIDSEEVRRYTSAAYGLASTLATGAYRPWVTGIDRAAAIERVIDIVTYVGSTHAANLASDLGWGSSVQSGMWASQAALAGWMLGPDLPVSTEVLLGRMLAFEAEVITGRQLHYLRDRAGKVLTGGNSGAEELAWDGVALWTAVELLPHHTRRTAWTDAAYRRFAGAYARPSDVDSNARVNGRPLAAWLKGTNAEQNGFVVNHARVNPDYTTDIALWGAPVSGLVGDGVPASMLVGVDWTYRALTSYKFVGPEWRAPGGTVYKPGSTTVYYPKGPDWGAHREVVFGALDAQTAVLSPTPTVRAVATKWAVAHLQVVRDMQARFKTGQIYGALSEDRYRSREEHAAMLLGNAYLTWWLATNKRLPLDQRPPQDKAALP